MVAKVILNPYSNRWNSGRRWSEAEAALKSAGVEFEMVASERPGQCADLAEAAARAGFSPIIVAGGDGTLDEVVNGLGRVQGDGLMGPIGFIPLGTANDLVDNLHMSKDLQDAARTIAAGKIRLMDVCSVNGKYFINNSAIGLEPYVTTIQARITWIKGIARYLVATLLAVIDNPHWQAKLEWDDGQFEGPISLVTVGNGPRTGGLFFMAPHADLFDGKLTFVHGYRKTRMGVITLLPETMKPEGRFVEMEGVREFNSTWLKIHLDHPSPAHTDGELFAEPLADLEYRILPGKLQVLMPG